MRTRVSALKTARKRVRMSVSLLSSIYRAQVKTGLDTCVYERDGATVWSVTHFHTGTICRTTLEYISTARITIA